jgi:Raf kinase inhibitor-like YbhB/YbcL family protein
MVEMVKLNRHLKQKQRWLQSLSRRLEKSGIGLAGMLLIGCVGGSGSPQRPFNLYSPVFRPQAALPIKHTCEGENLSPTLRWDQPPIQTQSLVLISDSLDAPKATRPVVHWVIYDIPSNVQALPEALPPDPILLTEEVEGVQGKNDFDRYGYDGPCPPGTHRYTFTLYALDRFLDLPPGATKDEVLAAMEGHILTEATLEGK